MDRIIRKPAVAGLFYPDDAGELKGLISLLLEENKPAKKYHNIFGIISPHAGYIYSGQSAAFAYNVLKESTNFETVIILSPSHKEYFEGSTIYNGDAYKTPLGEIPIEKTISKHIVDNCETVFFGNEGHKGEHAVEVQLPFLQVISEGFSIVPIVIGNQSIQQLHELSKILSEVIDEKTIIIASSDLSHFHHKAKAAELDNIVVDRINNFEYSELYNDLTNGNCEACGGDAIVTILETADIIGRKSAEVLSYTDSGDISNDNSSVVGYLSAVVYGKE
ncbi:MAG: AmmeMemoRadiSam system protein B [Melioribacteraceae bacterium]|nr:AmmeMemoRadiSam system protein B [Melioribacteraceae bacterium]